MWGLLSARKASVTPVMGSLAAGLTRSHQPNLLRALVEVDIHLVELVNLDPMNPHMIMLILGFGFIQSLVHADSEQAL